MKHNIFLFLAFFLAGNIGYSKTELSDFNVKGNVSVLNNNDLRLYELRSNGSNYVSLKSGSSVSSNISFELPGADGSAHHNLKTNGSGVLAFQDSLQSIAAAKGDIYVASGANTPSKLSLGSDGNVLTADSTEATGIKWATAPGAPSGAISAFGGTSAPSGWLMCDGTAVSRATYAALFAVIGTNFGSGDGSTTFNLPDFRGRFLRGTDGGVARDPDRASRTAMNTGGSTGDNVGSVQNHSYQFHKHPNAAGFSRTGPYLSVTGISAGASFGIIGSSSGGDVGDMGNGNNNSGLETRPINAGVNFIIKI